MKQTLVWSPGHIAAEEVRARAHRVHEEFTSSAGDKAMICLGSVKSNPVVEMVIADSFHAGHLSRKTT